jgi:GNAT superfamily N-acetyltransferase
VSGAVSGDDAQGLLALYDEQERARLDAHGEGEVVERVGGVVRVLYGSGRCFVTAPGLDDADADAAIAEQVRFFAGLDGGAGRAFEWKVYGHDRPADLGRRLVAAGFRAEDDEAFVVGSTTDVLAATEGTRLPAGLRLREVDAATLERDVVRIADLHTEVWGEPIPGYAERLLADKRADPSAVRLYVVETTDGAARVVSAARLELRPAWPGDADGRPRSDFAGLWGGSTVADWRGRGVYRSLVRVRAQHAAEAGVPWLQVDASPDSRPILERLGLRVLDTTTPHIWDPNITI